MEPVQASAPQIAGAELFPHLASASPPPQLTRDQAEIEAQRDALRVQVAAVAAQQSALLEEEWRLQQQQGALTQQQQQLAAHLEEKRQRILQFAEQLQTARAAFQKERQDHAHAWTQQTEQLTAGQKELEKDRKSVLADRERLMQLQHRLKKHFRRRFAAERKQLRKREAAVADQHQRIEREAIKVQQERGSLNGIRLRCNGDMELGKRILQAERQKLHDEQRQWKQERARKDAELAAKMHALQQRERTVADAGRVLACDQLEWEQKRKIAELEIDGLQNRIANQRQKLLGQQRQLDEVESRLLQAQLQKSGRAALEGHCSPPAAFAEPQVERLSFPIQQTVAELDRVADDLADQRLELVEHWQRVARTQLQWQEGQSTAVQQLESLAAALPRKEQAVLAQEAALKAALADLHERERELLRSRHHLEGWAAGIRLRESTWQRERSDLLAELRNREHTAEKRLAAIAALRQKWATRRQQELEAVQRERAACEKLHRQWAELRHECWKRGLALEQQQRELSEQALALEEFRQRFVVQSQDAAAVESQLERIRKHWAQRNAATARSNAEQLRGVQAEAVHLQQRGRDLLQIAEELATREANLAQRQTLWEESLLKADAREVEMQQQLQHAETQRQCSERHIEELQGQVERLARVLLDAVDAPLAKVA